MKTYEATTQSKLLRRTPVIIRVDGKAFHTWTKKINDAIDPSLVATPFSVKLHETMTVTARGMCAHMQNAELAYTQSDEISILLRDWDKHETEQWFDAKVQKIVSVAAAMATGFFNYHLYHKFQEMEPSWFGDIPLFDARVFNLPKEEVANYFIWRQQDASRNSVQMLGRHFFSAKQMHGKSNSDVQDMLMAMDTPVNWNDLPTWMKRGSCIIPNPNSFDSSAAYVKDEDIPIFTQDRNYIERYLMPEEDLLAEQGQSLVKKGGPIDVDQYKKK